MWSIAPLIVCPFTGTGLRAETREAVPDAQFVNVEVDEFAYWRLLCDLWAKGETFILVEHDIVPTREQIDTLWACPEEWCGSPYDMDGITTTAFGFVKFAAPPPRTHRRTPARYHRRAPRLAVS